MKTLTKPAKKKPRAVKRQVPATFTVRDLNRQPAEVLKACDKRGSVRIQTRDGRAYSLRAEPPAPPDPGLAFAERMQRHHERMKAAGFVPLTTKQLNWIVAGE